MTEKAYFFDSVEDDRIYNASDFARVFEGIVGGGVVPGKDNELEVVFGEGMEVIVQPGASWVQGRYYLNDASKALVVTEADPDLSRVDRVVLRVDLGTDARKIEAVIKTGTPAIEPAPPDLQQESLIYEFPLYRYTVEGNATNPIRLVDEREFMKSVIISDTAGAGAYKLTIIDRSLALEEVEK